MAKRRKTPVPSIRYPCVQPVWTGARWTFRARVSAGGDRVHGASRPTQEAAAADVAEIRRRIAERKRGSRAHRMTLADALDVVLTRMRASGAREVSIDADRQHAESIFRYLRREALVAQVRAEHLEAWLARALEDGRSPNTLAQRDRSILGRMFRAAGARLPDEVSWPRRSRPEMPHFTAEEIRELVARIRGSGRPHCERDAAWILLLASTGMRLGEAARLERRSIERRRIRVVNHKGRNVRYAPITPELEEPCRIVRESLPMAATALRAILRRWQARLDPRLSGRALRHTYGTMLHQLGVPLPDAMAAMGHLTHDAHLRYLHAANDGVERAAHAVSSALGDGGRRPHPPTKPTPHRGADP